MKKVLTICICILILCSFAGCSNKKNQEIADEFSTKVDQLSKNGIPIMSEVSSLAEEYNNLTDKQKELVSNYGTLKKYESFNLDLMNEVQTGIDSLSANTKIPYKDILDIYKKYNSLNSEEQTYISNIETLESAKELDEYDKASIAAVNFLKSMLKNESSLEINEISVKNEGLYYVVIDYSATNSFGGRNDNVACIDITDKFKAGMVALSILSGNFEEISTINYSGYLTYNVSEIFPDVDKVLDNLDKLS